MYHALTDYSHSIWDRLYYFLTVQHIILSMLENAKKPTRDEALNLPKAKWFFDSPSKKCIHLLLLRSSWQIECQWACGGIRQPWTPLLVIKLNDWLPWEPKTGHWIHTCPEHQQVLECNICSLFWKTWSHSPLAQFPLITYQAFFVTTWTFWSSSFYLCTQYKCTYLHGRMSAILVKLFEFGCMKWCERPDLAPGPYLLFFWANSSSMMKALKYMNVSLTNQHVTKSNVNSRPIAIQQSYQCMDSKVPYLKG